MDFRKNQDILRPLGHASNCPDLSQSMWAHPPHCYICMTLAGLLASFLPPAPAAGRHLFLLLREESKSTLQASQTAHLEQTPACKLKASQFPGYPWGPLTADQASWKPQRHPSATEASGEMPASATSTRTPCCLGECPAGFSSAETYFSGVMRSWDGDHAQRGRQLPAPGSKACTLHLYCGPPIPHMSFICFSLFPQLLVSEESRKDICRL